MESTLTTTPHPQHTSLRRVLAIAAILFGILTLVSGGKVLFGGEAARTAAGNIVEFVLIFNFAAGFFYVIAGILNLLRHPCALRLARLLAVATVGIFVALGIHIATGGAFEMRTVVAMTVRSAFWIAQALLLARAVKPQS